MAQPSGRQQRLADLAIVREISQDVLDRALQVLSAQPGDVILAPDDLVSKLADEAGVAEESGQCLMRVAFAAAAICKANSYTPAEAAAAYTAGVQAGPEWTPEKLASLLALVEKLMGCDTLRLSAAALDLAYDFASLLMGTRILTDIRPIYDDSGDEIKGAVVSHTLRIFYDSRAGESELSLTLDLSDIEVLKAQCERALRKMKSAEQLLLKAKIPMFVTGKSDAS